MRSAGQKTRPATRQSLLRVRHLEISVFVLLLVFASLACVAKSPALRAWDAGVSHVVQHNTFSFLTLAAEAFTVLGNGVGLAIIAVPVGLWLWRKRKPVGGVLLVGTISGHLLSVGLKSIVNRPRPGAIDDVPVLLHANGSSFPSGHALTAVLFFGFLAVLITSLVPNRPMRHLFITLSLVAASGICLSRIYLGAHFLSDVIAGIAAGLLFLLLWIEAYKRLAPKEFSPATANDVVSDATDAANE